jgi:hypothetical protein
MRHGPPIIARHQFVDQRGPVRRSQRTQSRPRKSPDDHAASISEPSRGPAHFQHEQTGGVSAQAIRKHAGGFLHHEAAGLLTDGLERIEYRAREAPKPELLRRGESYLAPIETPKLCKVPGLQYIMAAAHVRLSESRGCSTLRPCCIAPGTQAPQCVSRMSSQALRPCCVAPGHARVMPLLSRPCNPVNYRAGTGAPCKQQGRNRLPVKGEIYRGPSSSI